MEEWKAASIPHDQKRRQGRSTKRVQKSHSHSLNPADISFETRFESSEFGYLQELKNKETTSEKKQETPTRGRKFASRLPFRQPSRSASQSSSRSFVLEFPHQSPKLSPAGGGSPAKGSQMNKGGGYLWHLPSDHEHSSPEDQGIREKGNLDELTISEVTEELCISRFLPYPSAPCAKLNRTVLTYEGGGQFLSELESNTLRLAAHPDFGPVGCVGEASTKTKDPLRAFASCLERLPYENDRHSQDRESVFSYEMCSGTSPRSKAHYRWEELHVSIGVSYDESGHENDWSWGVSASLFLLVPPAELIFDNGFQGRDIISIFSNFRCTGERFSGIHKWNDSIPVPMQRYHLPFIGKILSPGDLTLSFSDIPPSPTITKLLSEFLFERTVFTPPSSGMTASDTAMGGMSPAGATFEYKSVFELSGILDVVDFPLACTLITHWFGFGSSRTHIVAPPLVKDLNPGTLEQEYTLYCNTRRGYVKQRRGVITAPYEVFPRRLWDLKVNRVIPYYLLQLPWNPIGRPEYVAISHSWVEAKDLIYTRTSINQGAWEVPLPQGIDLELIRNEVLGHFPSIRYCWLDVLCLRQFRPTGQIQPNLPKVEQLLDYLQLGQDPTGSLFREEVSIDVPTIGNIYRNAGGVLRYFNGLGKPFTSTHWDSPHHWLNRAWTLQEITTRMVNGGLMEECPNALNTISSWRGAYGRLREFLHDVEGAVNRQDYMGGVIALAREMRQRSVSKEIDKIAGLSYLLHFEELPVYSQDETVDKAWKRCLQSAPVGVLAELFFNCPLSGLCGLFPTWPQLNSSRRTFVRQQTPHPSSVRIHRPFLGLHLIEEWSFYFFGYKLKGCIKKIDISGNNYLIVAHPKLEARFPGMSINLRFFSPDDIPLTLSDDSETIYTLFTHSLNPCSTWVVLFEGEVKIGILCSDEVFRGLHRSQILEKGALCGGAGQLLSFSPKKM